MFDYNSFKKAVKDWMQQHPQGTPADLEDFCEDLIPMQSFSTHQWLVEQTVSWYRHILANRKKASMLYSSEEDSFEH